MPRGAVGRRALPGLHAGRPPLNKGGHCPADPPTLEEIGAVIRATVTPRHSRRLGALIVVPWRAGLRTREALGVGERTSTVAAARCSSAAARAAAVARSACTRGLGTTSAVERGPAGASGGALGLRDQRTGTWPFVVERVRARRPAPDGRGGGRAAAPRSASAPPRSCSRSVSCRTARRWINRLEGSWPVPAQPRRTVRPIARTSRQTHDGAGIALSGELRHRSGREPVNEMSGDAARWGVWSPSCGSGRPRPPRECGRPRSR